MKTKRKALIDVSERSIYCERCGQPLEDEELEALIIDCETEEEAEETLDDARLNTLCSRCEGDDYADDAAIDRARDEGCW